MMNCWNQSTELKTSTFQSNKIFNSQGKILRLKSSNFPFFFLLGIKPKDPLLVNFFLLRYWFAVLFRVTSRAALSGWCETCLGRTTPDSRVSSEMLIKICKRSIQKRPRFWSDLIEISIGDGACLREGNDGPNGACIGGRKRNSGPRSHVGMLIKSEFSWGKTERAYAAVAGDRSPEEVLENVFETSRCRWSSREIWVWF